jgi:O-antigen/teichoic acid export membrane protein
MWDNPIDLIIAALNSALEAAITGLGEALRGLRNLYRKLKLLFRVLLVTLLFLFPFLFFLFIGIKEEILWLTVLFGALLSIYAALIIRGFFKAVRKAEVHDVPITNRLPFSLMAIFTLLDIALISYWIASYNLGYNLVQEASFYLQHLREEYSLSALQLR